MGQEQPKAVTIRWISSAGQPCMTCAGTIDNDAWLPPTSRLRTEDVTAPRLKGRGRTECTARVVIVP